MHVLTVYVYLHVYIQVAVYVRHTVIINVRTTPAVADSSRGDAEEGDVTEAALSGVCEAVPGPASIHPPATQLHTVCRVCTQSHQSGGQVEGSCG